MNSVLPNKVHACPACGRFDISFLGNIPNYEGVIDHQGLSELYRCLNCSLMFRSPYLSPTQLYNEYSKITENKWDYHQDRVDHYLAASQIRRSFTSGNILDIGCFRGDFLMLLPEDFVKYGLEPAHSARKIAIERGISLLGNSIEKIDEDSPKFNVITLLDVIEHLPNPFESLRALAKLLTPKGCFIISTANTDVIPWRLMRNDYWYYISEHVCFFFPSWFRCDGTQFGFEVTSVMKFSHFRSTFFEPWKQLAQSLVFWALNRTKRSPIITNALLHIYPFTRARYWETPPKTISWRDHMIVVLQPKSAAVSKI